MGCKMLAPIIVFAYNRPEHLDRTLCALSENKEAQDSILYIIIDGPKNESGIAANAKVITVARKYLDGFFKKVIIRSSEQNKGLAKAVISGVTDIISQYGKVIVTEDDAVPAPYYIDFMNSALEFYQNDKNIWSIGGYTVKITLPYDYHHDVILTQRSSSYAWATWENRWNKIDWDIKDYKKFHWDFQARKQFNAWGDDRASMLDDQMLGRVNSWAIRFDYAMYKENMFNILPAKSLIKNIGHDGSGTHSVVDTSKDDPFFVDLARAGTKFCFERIEVDERIRKEFIIPFECSRVDLLKRFLGNFARSIWRSCNG